MLAIVGTASGERGNQSEHKRERSGVAEPHEINLVGLSRFCYLSETETP